MVGLPQVNRSMRAFQERGGAATEVVAVRVCREPGECGSEALLSWCALDQRFRCEMVLRELPSRLTCDAKLEILLRHRNYGPMLFGVQVLLELYGVGGVGGVAQGTLVKSKKSSRLGWAASRAVRLGSPGIKRFSTNLITAVWSMGMWET